MHWRSAIWGAFAGFCLAITMVTEIGTPWAFIIWASGWGSRALLGLAVKWIWGANLTTLWKRHRPRQWVMWQHAWAYVTGAHIEADPLICNHCRASLG